MARARRHRRLRTCGNTYTPMRYSAPWARAIPCRIGSRRPILPISCMGTGSTTVSRRSSGRRQRMSAMWSDPTRRLYCAGSGGVAGDRPGKCQTPRHRLRSSRWWSLADPLEPADRTVLGTRRIVRRTGEGNQDAAVFGLEHGSGRGATRRYGVGVKVTTSGNGSSRSRRMLRERPTKAISFRAGSHTGTVVWKGACPYCRTRERSRRSSA